VISSIICAIFSIGEGFDHNPVLNWDNNRYILVCVIPLIWYAFEVERKEGDACRSKDADGRGEDMRRSAIPRPRRPRASIPQASDCRR
jgi:hypothetical protein